MYSEAALLLRKCTAMNKDGTPCKAYALWSAPDQCCRKHTTYAFAGNTFPTNAAQVRVCRCEAYAWPHRPGSGLCTWPEQPKAKCDTPASTHSKHRRDTRPRAKRFSFEWVAGRDPIEKLLAFLETEKQREAERKGRK